ncbi:MAG: 16S rRNA (cytidine(1402)-2'-O)-methyltransferase [bacterium]
MSESRDRGRGCLYVVGTPIGNLEDLGERARRVLGEVDIVAAEDTRTAGRFLQRIGVKARLVSVFEGNEHVRAQQLVRQLRDGETVAMITESGTPAISDPGGVLVAACVAADVTVVPIPGPAAVTAVLSASGLDVGRFRFEGFLPRRGGERRRRIDFWRRDPAAVVVYESPHRLAATLAELAERLGPRRAVVAREVTKLYEEFARGTLPELASRFGAGPVKGEIVIVIEGAAAEQEALSDDDVERLVDEGLAAGESPRDIARNLAELTGRSRRALYTLANHRRDFDH